MARRKNTGFNVSGKSITDISNISIQEFNRLTESDLRKAVSRLASAANKRIRTFERKGSTSPAVEYISRSGGKFSTKGKTANELRAEFTRARDFLRAKTSTVKGVEKVKKTTIDALKRSGVNISPEQFDDFFKAYERLKETNPEIANKNFKYNAMRDLSQMMKNDVDVDDLITRMQEQLREGYEDETDDDDLSDFFEM